MRIGRGRISGIWRGGSEREMRDSRNTLGYLRGNCSRYPRIHKYAALLFGERRAYFPQRLRHRGRVGRQVIPMEGHDGQAFRSFGNTRCSVVVQMD
jgi:hypothetical protein